MELKIDGNKILKGEKEIGTIRKWCCGTDIRLEKHPALFSVLRVRKSETAKLIRCADRLLSIKKVKKGHYNLNMDTVDDDKKFEEYATAISKP